MGECPADIAGADECNLFPGHKTLLTTNQGQAAKTDVPKPSRRN